MKPLNDFKSLNFNFFKRIYRPFMVFKTLFYKLFLSLLLLFTTACSSLGVQPWERDILSKKEMIFGSCVLEAGFEDHTYFSKEGSSGGRSFSAGGCGCN